jgi:uncharacterized protein YfaS (alpha-2-macroglobulin family)
VGAAYACVLTAAAWGWLAAQADAGWEEYYDYIFPADSATEQPQLKLLAMAHRWKMQKEARAAAASAAAAAAAEAQARAHDDEEGADDGGASAGREGEPMEA